jgi:hypothetical protein
MEQKKSFRKVRCVSIKDDTVRFIPEHLVEEVCKTYKLEKQDLGTPKDTAEWEEAEEKTSFEDIVIKNPVLDYEKAKEEYERLSGKKAGNKKLETLLKEIEELTKQ